MSIKKIAVIGAGGPTGLEVARLLSSQHNTEVVAIVRTPTKHAEKFSALSSVKLVAGDVSSPSTLPLSGCSSAIFAASAATYWHGPHDTDYMGVVNTIASAKAHSVDHVVLISSRLVNPANRFHPIRMLLNNVKYSLMDYKFKGEEALRSSSLAYTIIRPGGLAGGHGYQTSRVAGEEHIVAAAAEGDCGDARSILRADVAAVVAQAVNQPEQAKNKTIEIVARPRRDSDESFSERLGNLFKDIPVS